MRIYVLTSKNEIKKLLILLILTKIIFHKRGRLFNTVNFSVSKYIKDISLFFS